MLSKHEMNSRLCTLKHENFRFELLTLYDADRMHLKFHNSNYVYCDGTNRKEISLKFSETSIFDGTKLHDSDFDGKMKFYLMIVLTEPKSPR